MSNLSRRQFIIASTITAGFAIATQPITATVINTDSTGLISGPVQIPVSDGEIPAYRAMPATGTNFPIILVIQEIFGVHAYIQDVCRRLAKQGYLAIAPALFTRQGDVSQLTDIPTIFSQVVSKVPDQQVMADLDATVNWAVKSSNGNGDKLGITGYCWGGRITWLYAAHNPQVKAGVAWYGLLNGERKALTPKQPVDIASSLTVPVLGLYAGKDDYIPNDQVLEMEKQLKMGNSGSEIIVYPDLPHGFHADYRPTYRQMEAKEAWAKLLAWFKKHGVA
jgi:carboxymethylenebutenolidase